MLRRLARRVRPLLALIAVILLSGCSDEATEPGLPAPKRLGVDLDGETVTTGEYRGRVLLVDFWASWSGACRMEFATLDTLKKEYGHRLQIVVVDILEPRARVENYLASHPNSARMVLDVDGSVATEFGIRGLPTSLLYDRAGFLHTKIAGHRPGLPQMRAELRRLLGPPHAGA